MTSDNGDTSNSNSNIIALKLSDEIKSEEIVSKFEFDRRIDSLRLSLNHKYHQKIMISPIEDNWPKTIDTFKKQLNVVTDVDGSCSTSYGHQYILPGKDT